MALNSSLRNRVRRLEERQADAAQPTIAERLRRARERWRAMTPQQRAAERCQRAARGVALVALPEPTGEDVESRLVRASRWQGQRHLAAMASLHEPDLAEPGPLPPNATVRDMDARCIAMADWSDQQRNREAARQYLADVALAGDLFKETP
ncbi:hypothetical protein [Roseateles sp. LYH14W]|uniref:Uncharacterized protein n=1 Tax=Pelomonas parva TaxID=3299032 RepID=A0ABW7EVM5_9BURK